MLPSRLGKAGLILTAAVFCPAQTEPPEADILVIARKMRTARLSYTLAGRHLKTCEPIVSSGDDRIDRIMCAVLRQCAASGKTEVGSARACVNERITMLEKPPELVTEALADEVPPVIVVASPHTAPSAPNELVVTAQRLPVLPGQWQFRQTVIVTGTVRGGVAHRPDIWRQCIPKDALLSSLGTILADPPTRRQPTYCREWNLELAAGQISGAMRCMLSNLRLTGTLTGSVDATQLFVRKQQRLKVIGAAQRADESIRVSEEVEKIIRIEGRRIGDCPRS